MTSGGGPGRLWRWLRRRYGDRLNLQRLHTSGRLRQSLEGPHPLSAQHISISVRAHGKGETAYQGRPWDLSQTPFRRARRLETSVTDGKGNANSTSHLACNQQLGIQRAVDNIISHLGGKVGPSSVIMYIPVRRVHRNKGNALQVPSSANVPVPSGR